MKLKDLESFDSEKYNIPDKVRLVEENSEIYIKGIWHLDFETRLSKDSEFSHKVENDILKNIFYKNYDEKSFPVKQKNITNYNEKEILVNLKNENSKLIRRFSYKKDPPKNWNSIKENIIPDSNDFLKVDDLFFFKISHNNLKSSPTVSFYTKEPHRFWNNINSLEEYKKMLSNREEQYQKIKDQEYFTSHYHIPNNIDLIHLTNNFFELYNDLYRPKNTKININKTIIKDDWRNIKDTIESNYFVEAYFEYDLGNIGISNKLI